MHKSFFRSLVVGFALFLLGTAASAQNPTPTPDSDLKTFEVRLPVTVTNRDGKEKDKLVAGMSRGDFLVFEDGVQQEVTFFSD